MSQSVYLTYHQKPVHIQHLMDLISFLILCYLICIHISIIHVLICISHMPLPPKLHHIFYHLFSVRHKCHDISLTHTVKLGRCESFFVHFADHILKMKFTPSLHCWKTEFWYSLIIKEIDTVLASTFISSVSGNLKI